MITQQWSSSLVVRRSRRGLEVILCPMTYSTVGEFSGRIVIVTTVRFIGLYYTLTVRRHMRAYRSGAWNAGLSFTDASGLAIGRAVWPSF